MELTFNLKQTPAFVFEYLTNMEKFTSVHPVITKIERTGDATYRVYETLSVGRVPFSFTYPVKIESDVIAKTVVMHATVLKLIHIKITFLIREEHGITQVKEHIQFKSFLYIKPIMEKIFKQQHTLLFKNMALKV